MMLRDETCSYEFHVPYFNEASILLKKLNLQKYLELLVINRNMAFFLHNFLTITSLPTDERVKDNSRILFGHCLNEILSNLPVHKRLAFIFDTMQPEHIKEIYQDLHVWHQLKTNITDENDRLALEKLIFSEEQLTAKQTLKAIKKTIQQISWPLGMFSNNTFVRVGQTFLEVPDVILKQVNELHLLSAHKKTPVEALNEIKMIGQAEAEKNRQSLSKSIEYFFFGKSVTDKYFESFDSNEVFNKSYVI